MSGKYDIAEAYRAGGAARVAWSDKGRDTYSQVKKDPPVPAGITREMGFYISKTTVVESQKKCNPKPQPDQNKALCEACRRIFDDLGESGPIISPDESGAFFMHWDIPRLEVSASEGCPLCLLIRRALNSSDLTLAREQALPGRYDYGNFMIEENIYALR